MLFSLEMLSIIYLFSCCLAGAVILTPFALSMAGFSAAGITAGSLGAGMMSSAAIANGGGVAAGSLVALLQSAGIY